MEKTKVSLFEKTHEIIVPPSDGKKKEGRQAFSMPQSFIGAIADEVAKIVIQRLPSRRPRNNGNKTAKKKQQELERAIFLDTSAIIDGRIFDVFELELVIGNVIVIESILLELKHIADSQDMVRRERGRKGLEALEKLKKVKSVKLLVVPENGLKEKLKEVDERLIAMAKKYKGRIITCDYNLEKKAVIGNVRAVNVHELANRLKITAVPGETLHMLIQHVGKDPTQGVGYLEDGTMVVVEMGSSDVGKAIDIVVSRVIQTASGRILFAKKI